MSEEAPVAETEAAPEAPAVEEEPVKKEPAALKMWKAAEKPAYEKMPPNTPRKPIDKDIEKETELSKDQLKSILQIWSCNFTIASLKILFSSYSSERCIQNLRQ